MKTRTKYVKTDDDMDDIPLKYITNGGSGVSKIQSIRDLRRHSVQMCEFCETRCKNRYNMFIHNSKHIIIPLLKEMPLYCRVCGAFCISAEHLENHTTVKHGDLIKTTSPCNDKTVKEALQRNNVFELDNEHDVHMDEYITDDLINEDVCDLTDEKPLGGVENILKNFMTRCKVELEKFEPPKLFNIKHEDNVEYIINSSLEPSSELSSADDPISLFMNNDKVKSDDEHYESVHYDDLMKLMMVHCKHCMQRFPNRYEAIIHELVHMDLTKVTSKKRKRRKRRKHKDNVPTDSPTVAADEPEMETQCQKQTNGARREPTSHKYSCHICSKGYNCSKLLARHIEKSHVKGGRILNVCDACFFTSRHKKTVEFTCIGRLTDLAVKQKCRCCGKFFHEVALVKPKLKQRWRIADRIQFEESPSRRSRPAKHLHRTISNSARLKVIQNRIKLINKYNAIYFILFFLYMYIIFYCQKASELIGRVMGKRSLLTIVRN